MGHLINEFIQAPNSNSIQPVVEYRKALFQKVLERSKYKDIVLKQQLASANKVSPCILWEHRMHLVNQIRILPSNLRTRPLPFNHRYMDRKVDSRTKRTISKRMRLGIQVRGNGRIRIVILHLRLRIQIRSNGHMALVALLLRLQIQVRSNGHMAIVTLLLWEMPLCIQIWGHGHMVLMFNGIYIWFWSTRWLSSLIDF